MRRTSSAVVAALFVTTLTIADVGMQSTSPAFDAASVKPNKSGDPRTSVALQAGGRFTATNVPLRALIGRAYGAPGTLVRAFSGLSNSQLVGGPDWINAERFDIVATAGTNATPDQVRAMLRTLLADRFKLAVHTEKRTVSAFALVMAGAEKTLGPRLRSATVDCGSAASSSGPPYPDGPPPCDWIGPAPRSAASSGQPTMAFRGFSMETFAAFLTPTVRRVVLDRTGLNGYFDGEFDMSAELGPPPPPPGTSDPVDRPSLPSIFTVLQEQLGLKLASTTAPVDVLVIDHVERSTPD